MNKSDLLNEIITKGKLKHSDIDLNGDYSEVYLFNDKKYIITLNEDL